MSNESRIDTIRHEFIDREINSLNQDKLGRADYARSLADAIIRWKEPDSLVLGICGDWGSGKTSLKNMVVDAFVEKNFEYYRVDFNPWEWSSQEQVSQAFFHELIAKLKSTPGINSKLPEKLAYYAECLKLGSDITAGLRKGINYSLLVAGLICGSSLLSGSGANCDSPKKI
jgi:hypothetical protein